MNYKIQYLRVITPLVVNLLKMIEDYQNLSNKMKEQYITHITNIENILNIKFFEPSNISLSYNNILDYFAINPIITDNSDIYVQHHSGDKIKTLPFSKIVKIYNDEYKINQFKQ